MNERIRELAREAAGGLLDYTAEGEWKLSQNEAEKFAQLIVRECVNIVKPTQHHEAWAQSYLGGVDGLELLDSRVEKIKQHFGVAE